jgi:hypothetical protein
VPSERAGIKWHKSVLIFADVKLLGQNINTIKNNTDRLAKKPTKYAEKLLLHILYIYI